MSKESDEIIQSIANEQGIKAQIETRDGIGDLKDAVKESGLPGETVVVVSPPSYPGEEDTR